jgi:ribonuclease Z
MELTFFGTASGSPTRKRNVSGLALAPDSGRNWYLIDCGEATQHQLLHAPYSLARLQAIFITHVHGDHIFGLPGLLTSASMNGRQKRLPIVAPPQVKAFVEIAISVSDSALGFEIDWIDVSRDTTCWQDGRFSVERVALSHRVPSWAYVFDERSVPLRLLPQRLAEFGIERGPLWGALQRGESVSLDSGREVTPAEVSEPHHRPRRLVIAGDNDTPELLTQACANADVLVHEATFTRPVAERLGTTYQHSCADQVARFAQTVGLPGLILTHFSGRYQLPPNRSPHSIEEVRAEARQHYQGQLILAEDLVSYHLSRDGSLSIGE